jgi:hypothetical protein
MTSGDVIRRLGESQQRLRGTTNGPANVGMIVSEANRELSELMTGDGESVLARKELSAR